MKDTPGTGCGIWPFIFHGWMNPACEWHDNAYIEGSWHQSHMTRREVDDHFLSMCLFIAKDNECKIAQAHCAYAVVRALGWLFWEGELGTREDKFRIPQAGETIQMAFKRGLISLQCPLKDWKVAQLC